MGQESRNIPSLPHNYFTSSISPWASFVIISFFKISVFRECLLKDPLARDFRCPCHNLVLLEDFVWATPSVSQTLIMLGRMPVKYDLSLPVYT